jgi:hypothetical protein
MSRRNCSVAAYSDGAGPPFCTSSLSLSTCGVVGESRSCRSASFSTRQHGKPRQVGHRSGWCGGEGSAIPKSVLVIASVCEASENSTALPVPRWPIGMKRARDKRLEARPKGKDGCSPGIEGDIIGTLPLIAGGLLYNETVIVRARRPFRPADTWPVRGLRGRKASPAAFFLSANDSRSIAWIYGDRLLLGCCAGKWTSHWRYAAA